MVDVTIKDYQDWLKNNKQVKVPKEGEALSAFDEQENRALYAQYVNEAELLRQRQDAEARLSEQKASALRDNYVQQAQAQKKAEDAVKMQGITTGASQSDLIDLYAKGAAARAGIIQANDNAKNDVFSAYRQALAESKASTNKTIAEIGVKRAEKEETDLANKKTDAKTKLQNMMSGYLSGVTSKDELDSFYNENSSYIDDEYLTSLYNKIDGTKANQDFEAALTNYGNGLLDIGALTKMYEEGANVALDNNLISLYQSALQREAEAESAPKAALNIAEAIEKYNSDEIDFEELKNIYTENEEAFNKTDNYEIYGAYQDLARKNKNAQKIEDAITEFEKATGVDVKDGGKTLEELDADFFGYSEKEFEALEKVIEDAKRRGDIKDGEYVNVLLNGIANINNLYTYYNGRFYKTNTFNARNVPMKNLALYPDKTYSMLTENKTGTNLGEELLNGFKNAKTIIGSWFE